MKWDHINIIWQIVADSSRDYYAITMHETKRSVLLLAHLVTSEFCTSDLKKNIEGISASGSSSVK